jgi:hypothetical protein
MMFRPGGFVQGNSLSGKEAPLEHLFKSIQKQSGYHFLYTDELVRTASPVSVSLKDVTLDKALEHIFSGQPFRYTILERTIVVKAKRASPQLAMPAPTATEPLGERKKPGEINTLEDLKKKLDLFGM